MEKKNMSMVLSAFVWSTMVVAYASADAPNRNAQTRDTTATATATATTAEGSAAGTVNIQTATAEELQRLPGIGPAKAAAIVEFRTRNPFRRVEDLMRVRGVGRAIFRNVRSLLSLTGSTTLTVRPAARRSASAETDVDEANAE